MKPILMSIFLGAGLFATAAAYADDSLTVRGEYALRLASALDKVGALKDEDGKYQVNNAYCSSYHSYSAYHCLLNDINQSSRVIQVIGPDAGQLMTALESAGLGNGIDGDGTLTVKSFYFTCTLAEGNDAHCSLTRY